VSLRRGGVVRRRNIMVSCLVSQLHCVVEYDLWSLCPDCGAFISVEFEVDTSCNKHDNYSGGVLLEQIQRVC
jgi:hypothetical protein